MIRGTTPPHTFVIKNEDFDTSTIVKVNVLYSQDYHLLFRKKHEDCVVSDNTISTKLTREESLMFVHNKPAQIQLVYETSDGDVQATDIMTCVIGRLLDDGELE